MSDDPEELHRRLTSGDAGRVIALGADLGDQSRAVDAATAVLTAGMHTPTWFAGVARLGFLIRGQQAFLAACTASWRLYRTAHVVTTVGEQYTQVCEQADSLIRPWRKRDPSLTPEDVETLRDAVARSLRLLTMLWALRLLAARGDLDDTDPELERWFEDGAIQDYWYYVRTGAGRGPRIPGVLLSGDEDGFAPQGLAYDRGSGSWLLTSYRDGEPSRLNLIDERTGERTNEVQLTGPRGSGSPHHAGGVAVDGRWAYVVSSEESGSYVYRYDLQALRDARPGQDVAADAKIEVSGSSYATVAQGKLWLGNWKDGELYPYDLDEIAGAPDGSRPVPPDHLPAPEGANGVVVQGDRLVFAVNNGRHEESELVTTDRDGNEVHSVELGNMVEEIHLLDGRIYALNESGAEPYSPFDDGTKDPEDLWAQTHLLSLPFGQVTGEVDVEPPTLREARREFVRATDAMERIAQAVRRLDLPARLLGEVASASAFASAVTTEVENTGRALDAGVDNATGAATGLGRTADEYETADTSGATVLDLITGRLG